MLARQAAGRDGRAREIESSLPRARLRVAAGHGGRRAPQPRSEAASCDAPTAPRYARRPPRSTVPTRSACRRHAARLGRRRGRARSPTGSTRRPSRSTASSSACRAEQRLPALARVPDGVRRRRGAPRALGDDGDRESRDGRGGAHRARRERVLPRRHLAPRVRPGDRAAERCSSSSRRRRRPAPRAPTRARGRTSRSRATPTTRCSASCCRARARTRTLQPSAGGSGVAPRPAARWSGLPARTEHLTVGHLEVQAGRDAPPTHAHGGDEVLYVTAGRAARAGLARRRDVRVRAAPRRRLLLPAGARHEYRNYGAATVRAVFGVAPSYA